MKTLSNNLFNTLIITSTFLNGCSDLQLINEDEQICSVDLSGSKIEVADTVWIDEDEFELTENQKDILVKITYQEAESQLNYYNSEKDYDVRAEQGLLTYSY